MALSIKDPEADRLARDIAERTGETLTGAIVVALRERLARLRAPATRPFETSMVLESRFGEVAGRELDLFVAKVAIDVVPIDAAQLAEARRAWRRFGRGRHAACLNLGDLFSYVLSRTTGQPLLFIGDDFARTDVGRVL
ncbi:MAG: type II toxin-antitoxin system VapC family toxin [Acidimicrobiia bacterium]